MKISVRVIVDIPDPEQWTTTYGVEGAQAIREDVKTHVGNIVQGSAPFGSGEVDAEVSWS